MPSVPVKESATGNESGEPEIQRSDLPETASLKVLDGDSNKPPSVPIETDPLVSPQCPGLEDDMFSIFFFFYGLFYCLYLSMHMLILNL